MRCPRCFAPMTTHHRQNVEIDVCPRCHGVFLDGGELDQIVDRYGIYDKPHHVANEMRDHRGREKFWQRADG